MNKEAESSNKHFRCGYVTILGRPNVGKSTLLNHLIGQKLSITTRKPQTTRHQLLGIKNNPDSQILYVDTPGFQAEPKNAMNRYMNREIKNALVGVDLLVFVIDGIKWTELDQQVLKQINTDNIPVLLVINKIDRLEDRNELLPFIEEMKSQKDYLAIVPMSALDDKDVGQFEALVTKYLPFAAPVYDNDQLTNRNLRFFAAEFIREKLTQKLGDELPYQLTVTIDQFKQDEKRLNVHATIWVAKQGQKGIVIGKNGAVLKSVGEQSRKDMQELFQQKVHLETWVKVKGKWTDDEKALRQFDFDI